MSILKKESAIEKIGGNFATESALTLIGALSGNPICALLPVLSNSLANTRHKQRIEAALFEVNHILTLHESKIRDLTDGQYKLINETILSFLQTTCATKINYLKIVIRNSLNADIIIAEDAAILSRTIRDISADEILFLIKYFSYKQIVFDSDSNSSWPNDVLRLKSGGKEELTCGSLSSLGLLASSGLHSMGGGYWRFTSLVAKIIVLLKD